MNSVAGTIPSDPEPMVGESASQTAKRTKAIQRTQVAATWFWLVASMAILVCSFMFEVAGDRRVVVRGWGAQLPESCSMYARFGINCPGCGLTRSFVHMSAGEIGKALKVNPVGIVGYLFLLMQIPIASALLLSPEKRVRWISRRWERTIVWANQWALVWLMIALCVQWVFRLLLGV